MATRRSWEEAGCHPELLHVVLNGIEIPSGDSVPVLQGGFRLGMFARFTPYKGFEVVLEALASMPDVHLYLFGEAERSERAYYESLQRAVHQGGLTGRCHFMGFRRDIGGWMRAVDAVIHPSTHPEAFGRVLVEAMLLRRPLLASEFEEAREVLGYGRNFPLRPGDSGSVVEAVSWCRAQSDAVDAMLDRAESYALQTFSASRMLQQVGLLVAGALAEESNKRCPRGG
jgi:glycosyltransferase involved in cell wall biosynthesis